MSPFRPLYDSPASTYTCRHCGQTTGPDPEICINCGPVCNDCFNLACPQDLELQASKLFSRVLDLFFEAYELRHPSKLISKPRRNPNDQSLPKFQDRLPGTRLPR